MNVLEGLELLGGDKIFFSQVNQIWFFVKSSIHLQHLLIQLADTENF